MICKDDDTVVKDDYNNIGYIKDEALVSKKQEGYLWEANRLRNRLVHDYNELDDDLAIQSLMKLSGQLVDILEVFDSWLKQKR